MKKILLVFTIFMLLVSTDGLDAKKKKKAPGIALEDINGKFTMLSQLLKKSNVFLSFWSYDCVPCRKEMPELNKMAKEGLFKEKNVKLVFVYVEASTAKTKKGGEKRPPKEKALEILNKFDVKEMCLMDIYGVAFNNYRKACKIKKTTLPLNFLIDKNGKIVYKAIGYKKGNLKKFEKAIKKRL